MMKNLFVCCLIVAAITAASGHRTGNMRENGENLNHLNSKETSSEIKTYNAVQHNNELHRFDRKPPGNFYNHLHSVDSKSSEIHGKEKSNTHNQFRSVSAENYGSEVSNNNKKKGNSTTQKPKINSGKTESKNNKNKAKKRICEKKYAEIISRIFPDNTDEDDEDFNGRTLADPGEYPHMAAVGFATSTDKFDFKCGGSLISENFVITAAHCTNQTGQKPTRVRIGDLNLKIRETYLEPQSRQIKNIFVHPQYTPTSYYNDIALLELSRDVEFTEFVRPIRLWTRSDLPFLKAFAMGYGSTAFAKVQTNRLTHLNMTIVNNDECNRKLPAMPEAEWGIVESQICALDYEMNRDTCQGDSGGPLQISLHGKNSRNRKFYHLIGITSYGLVCRSGYPSVYTRVFSYLDWIESVVWPEISVDE